jgi:hypothetical protein
MPPVPFCLQKGFFTPLVENVTVTAQQGQIGDFQGSQKIRLVTKLVKSIKHSLWSTDQDDQNDRADQVDQQ